MADREYTLEELQALDKSEDQEYTLEELEAVDTIAQEAPVEKDSSFDLGAAGRGAAQGLSFGFADELAGALTAPIGALKQAGKSMGVYEPELGDESVAEYKRKRDIMRALDAAAKKRSPWSFGAGELAGGMAIPVPGVGVAKGLQGAGKLAKLGKAALSGAGQGALYGVGLSESENPGSIATSAGLGAGFGGITSKLAPKVVQALGKKMRGVGEKQALGAAGFTGKEIAEAKPGMGESLIDEGIVRFGGTTEGAGARATQKLKQSAAGLDDSLKGLDAAGGEAAVQKVQLEQYLKKIQQETATEPALKDVAAKFGRLSDDVLEEVPESGLALSKLEKFKRGYGKRANKFGEEEVAKGAQQKMYLGLKDLAEEQAERISPELADKFKADKKLAGAAIPVKKAAEKRSGQEYTGLPQKFKDLAMVGMGASMGGIPGAVAAVVGRRVIEPRWRSSMGVGLNKIGKLVETSAEKLGQYFPVLNQAANRGSLPVYHHLMMQSDPEYRKLMNELIEEQE